MSGIYIHIPFCKKQCSYCDFHFSTTFEVYRTEMISSICKELVVRAREWENKIVETIYLGGGTPSILSIEELQSILKTLDDWYTVYDNVELTLECNPDDCSMENLLTWKQLGINRLSIGLQSLDQSQLSWMNRAHNANESINAVLLAHECGFTNITVDLIYGLPGLTEKEWKHTIDEVVKLPVQHISAYCLTVEEKTPLASWVKSGKIKPVGNNEQSDQFVLLVERLAFHGFEQYEISNFAKSGAYSKHNTSYWQNKPYLGIGPSAHGFDGNSRYWNVANNRRYMKELNENILPEEREELSKYDKFNERLMVGLRTKWGVPMNELSVYLDLDVEWMTLLEDFAANELLEFENGIIRLTQKGKLRADAISSDLFKLSN